MIKIKDEDYDKIKILIDEIIKYNIHRYYKNSNFYIHYFKESNILKSIYFINNDNHINCMIYYWYLNFHKLWKLTINDDYRNKIFRKTKYFINENIIEFNNLFDLINYFEKRFIKYNKQFDIDFIYDNNNINNKKRKLNF